MIAYLSYSLFLSGWVYPIIAHAIWSSRGFLSATAENPLWGAGMVDFAGSGVVHLTGGSTALLAAIILGPRRGRFHDESGRRLEAPREFPGSSFSLQVCSNFLTFRPFCNEAAQHQHTLTSRIFPLLCLRCSVRSCSGT